MREGGTGEEGRLDVPAQIHRRQERWLTHAAQLCCRTPSETERSLQVQSLSQQVQQGEGGRELTHEASCLECELLLHPQVGLADSAMEMPVVAGG